MRHVLGTRLLVLAIAVPTTSLAVPPAAATPQALAEAYGKLPLSFESNAGQVSREVDFLCRGAGMTLFLSGGEAVLSLRGSGDSRAVVRMRPMGSARHAHATGLAPQITRTNYFLGNDPKHWHRDIPNYGQVRYGDVYPGIDLIFRGNERRLEYDLVIAPKADPSQIRLALSGADSVEIDPQGGLILHTAAGDLVQPSPTVYQEGAEGREMVQGHYVLAESPDSDPAKGRREVGFELGSYDRTRALVIDPVIVYSTFLGGTGKDLGIGIAVDGSGNAYITGQTISTTFPGVTGSSIKPTNPVGSDAFVTKINAAGTAIVYSTFLGGTGFDLGTGIAVDGSGNAYVTGVTNSTTFPGVTVSSIQPANAGGIDAFVTKINAAGTAIVYSTFLGGSGSDQNTTIAVDGSGNAYVMGDTDSTTFPGVTGSSIQPANAGGIDAFVTKINAAGTAIAYSTFLGSAGDETGRGITVDGNGNAYVTGSTNSTTFPGVTGSSIQPANGGGLKDGFVTKISAAAITTINPNAGPVGGTQSVTITGSNLSSTTSVTFGGAAGSITANTATSITVTTPAHAAGAVDVVATSASGTATSTGGYTYVVAPTITIINPSVGPLGGSQSVTITGSNLSSASVTIGGNPATVTGTTATTAMFTTPAHTAGAVDVIVTTVGGSATSTGGYTYVPAPTITNISPASGPASGGQGVMVTGTNLSSATTVTFGGTAGAITATSATSISVTTSAHAAGPVDVAVTTAGGSATVNAGFAYIPPAPAFVDASATSPSSVLISWTSVASANSYKVFRNSGSGFLLLSTVTSLTYTDSTVSPGTAYLYRVRAVASGISSADSNRDLATTVIFTDDPLLLGATVVKAVHLTEMRTAVNAVRALASLSAATWTDPSPVGVTIKAVHLTELRTALDAARSLVLLPSLSYTGTLTAGTSPVAEIDFTEIRNGTK